MAEKKQTIGFWGMFIIFLLVIAFVALLSSGGKSQKSTQSSIPVYTAENCIHDLAIRNANAVKRDMDNGVSYSDTEIANQLNEYERQKSECYKNYK